MSKLSKAQSNGKFRERHNQSIPLRPDRIFQNFPEIFTGQGALPVSMTTAANLPLVSTTPVANFSTIFASVDDTGGKFATGVNDTGGKFVTSVNDTSGKQWNNYQTGDNLK